MPWARLDDRLTFHPKVMAAGNEAFGVWARMLTYVRAHLTDGVVTKSVAEMIAASGDGRVLKRLVTVGLLDPHADGYRIHDYDEIYDPDESEKAKRTEVSEMRREAGRQGAKRRWQNGWQNGKPIANGMANDSDFAIPPPMANGANGKTIALSDPIRSVSDPVLSEPSTDSLLRSEQQGAFALAAPVAPKQGTKQRDRKLGQELIGYYCDRWREIKRPADGKAPKLDGADGKAGKMLATAYGLATAKKYVDRFLADADGLLIKRGHLLRDITARVNAYRVTSTGPPGKVGYAAPGGHNETSTDATDEL